MIDTLRRDHLSLYGYDRATSPYIDALAKDSIVFDRCIATSPWTLPSTLSLLSGLYPERHGVQTVAGKQQVSQDVEMLAERLSAHGYRTAAFSENPYVSPVYGVDQGFELFAHSLAPAARAYRDLSVPVGKARAWLEALKTEAPDEPFFLYLHVMNVHGPYKAPDPYRERFLETPSEPFPFKGPLWEDIMVRRCATCRDQITEPHLRDLRARYDGAIAYTDEVLGEFLQELRTSGVLDSAVLVVTSDHGEELFDHGGFGHGKSLHAEMLDVPLLIRPPGGAPPRRIEEPVSQIDLPATLLDLLDLAPPEEQKLGDGISLASLVRGEAGDSTGNDTEINTDDNGASELASRPLLAQVDAAMRARALMIQQWPWRLIETTQDYRGRSGTVELYDLEADPGERDDRASREPERLRQMIAVLRETQRELAREQARQGPAIESSAELERRLEALGYVEEHDPEQEVH